MCSDSQFFLRGQKLENHFGKLWIFAKLLRDFWIFVKMQNGPFSRPIYHQTVLDTEKKSYSTTIGTEKQKKCTSQIFNFWKMLFRSLKKVCDEFSKIKNLRCTFFSFFRADRRGIWLFFRIQNCLVVNWPRKWAVFDFWKRSKISQHILQKSMSFKNDFSIFGRVKV